jgi:polyhydroxybutyrate depolymerase
MESIIVDGRARSYLLHLPPQPEGRPLIIALHALGSNPLLMEAMTDFSSMADREGFIAAYPEGFKSSDAGARSWNARFCCRDAKEEGVDDIGFLSALIDQMTERYHTRGVLITGFSNGGMLAHLAGIELADKITAIAPVAATVGKEMIEQPPKGPIPVLMVHGSEDRLIPFDHRDDERFLPVSRVVEYWVRNDRCEPAPIVEESEEMRKERYTPRSDGAEVLLYKVKNAGHVWPGSRVHMRTEHDPRTVDASSLIWSFFRSHLR